MRGHAAMLCFSALIAGSFSLGGMIANEIDPAALNAVRFFIAAMVIGALAMATGGIPQRSFAAPWRYLVLGGLFAFYFVLMFEGLKPARPFSAPQTSARNKMQIIRPAPDIAKAPQKNVVVCRPSPSPGPRSPTPQ